MPRTRAKAATAAAPAVSAPVDPYGTLSTVTADKFAGPGGRPAKEIPASVKSLADRFATESVVVVSTDGWDDKLVKSFTRTAKPYLVSQFPGYVVAFRTGMADGKPALRITMTAENAKA